MCCYYGPTSAGALRRYFVPVYLALSQTDLTSHIGFIRSLADSRARSRSQPLTGQRDDWSAWHWRRQLDAFLDGPDEAFSGLHSYETRGPKTQLDLRTSDLESAGTGKLISSRSTSTTI